MQSTIPNTWQDILTVYDDSLISEGSIDPLGMQLIWSDFGQRIFDYKLTTVSNDIRNFTLNLFHHYILRRLFKSNPGFYSEAVRKFGDYKSDPDVKSGILIFLEDLLAHSMVHLKYEMKEDVDLYGLLGSSKAEQQFDNNKESILLEAERTKGVLVRQIVLGINGRYKGPFLSMGLLATRSLEYVEGAWGPVEQLFENWDEALKLGNQLTSILQNMFASQSGLHPQVLFEEFRLDQTLLKQYQNCFGRLKIFDELRKFWEDMAGLTSGAGEAIYLQMALPDDALPSLILSNALNQIDSNVESRKVSEILLLEPFLTVCSQLFYRMTDPSTRYLESIVDEVSPIINSIDLNSIKPLCASNSRLKLLVDHIGAGNQKPLETLNQLVIYHEEIMNFRGNYPWLEIIRGNQVKHFIYQKSRYTTDELIKAKLWYHSYYIPTLRSIYRSLRGNK